MNYKRTILVSLPFMAFMTFWSAYDGIIPLMLKNTFHIGDTVSGVVMALDNILAVLLLPIFGSLSDKTKSRYGRRMPYILLGTLFAVLGMPLIPLGDYLYNFPMFIIGLGVVLLALSSYRSAEVALMPDVTPSPYRSKADALNSLSATAGTMVILACISLLVPAVKHPDYMAVFAVIMVLMTASALILFFTVKEPEAVARMQEESRKLGVVYQEDTVSFGGKETLPADVKRSLLGVLACVFFFFFAYNATSSALSKYANVMWGMEGGSYATLQLVPVIVTLFAYLPMAGLAVRIGRKKTVITGGLLLIIAYGALFSSGKFSPVLYVYMSMIGIGMAAVSINVYPMIMEISTPETTGKYTGYYYTASMTAQIITPVLSGAVMEFIGYRYLFLYAFIFGVITLIPLLFVHHGDVMKMEETAPQPTGQMSGGLQENGVSSSYSAS